MHDGKVTIDFTDGLAVWYGVRPTTLNNGDKVYEVVRETNEGGRVTLSAWFSTDEAYDYAYTACQAEHEQLGYPPGDERIQYPRHPDHADFYSDDNSTPYNYDGYAEQRDLFENT